MITLLCGLSLINEIQLMRMSLTEKINTIFKENKRLIIGGSVYLAATVVDYSFTQYVFETAKDITDENPLMAAYVSSIGPKTGIALAKACLYTSVIAASFMVDNAYRRKKTRWKSDYLLYPGAALTLAPAAVWALI